MITFEELQLSKAVIRATASMGFEEATPIQELAIPAAMKGGDIIGQARTGTGKTAAFGIPMVEMIEHGLGKIEGLVIAPTRELAVQVAEEINTLGQFKGVRVLPIYGGQDINRQIKALKSRPQIIAATPGRLMDHLRRKTIRLRDVGIVVLDEADEMLNMGFIEDIESILKAVPRERQTLLFSATMPGAIRDLACRFMKDPEYISVKSKEVTVPQTDQFYVQVPDRQKFDLLCRLLDMQSPESAIVFSRTKRRVDEICDGLKKRGYPAEALHGDLAQAKRDRVTQSFRDGYAEILVATDVAARGLDFSDLSHVYNFDIPQDPDSYVHRIGRTGRVGKPGAAVTFVTPREIGHLQLIERSINRKIVSISIPTMGEALEGKQRQAVEQLMQVVEEGKTGRYKMLAEELLDRVDPVSLLSAALKLLTGEPNTTPVILTEEAPFKKKKYPRRPFRPRKKGRRAGKR
jgi:ATP-dependent RNA helicase DeaD